MEALNVAAIGFDLDNTLYDQSQYMMSFFETAASWLADDCGAERSEILATLIKVWRQRTSYYPYLFDEALQELGLWSKKRVAELVRLYRNHPVPIALYQDAVEILAMLSRRYPLVLITNGHATMQRRKVTALGIERFFRGIIYTDTYGADWRKPSRFPFEHAVRLLGVSPDTCLYVADNPLCDFSGAREAGLVTVRVLRGAFAGLKVSVEQDADYHICNLTELPGLIEHLS